MDEETEGEFGLRACRGTGDIGEGGTDDAGLAKEVKYANSLMSDIIPVRVPAVPGGDLMRTISVRQIMYGSR